MENRRFLYLGLFLLVICVIFGKNYTGYLEEMKQEQYDLGYEEGVYDAFNPAWNNQEYIPYQVRTEEDSLILWDEPSLNSKKVGSIPQYEYVGVGMFSEDEKWASVLYGELLGWVEISYLELAYDVFVYIAGDDGLYHKKECDCIGELLHIMPLTMAVLEQRIPCPDCGGYGYYE